MPGYRAQAVLQAKSGVPRDAITNTFWFIHVLENQAVAEEIGEAVRDFYTATHDAVSGFGLASDLAGSIATNGHAVKVSPIDIPTGNDTRGINQPPLHVEPFDLLGRNIQEQVYPNEVALCLSFRNDSVLSKPVQQRRGRIYFGPLEQQATFDPVTGVLRPDAGIQRRLRAAGVFLRDHPMTAEWVIYSRPFEGRGEVVRPGRRTLPALPARAGATTAVEKVWTDDAFDTQRRRGERPTTRIFA